MREKSVIAVHPYTQKEGVGEKAERETAPRAFQNPNPSFCPLPRFPLNVGARLFPEKG